jgi:hypothetical protein
MILIIRYNNSVSSAHCSPNSAHGSRNPAHGSLLMSYSWPTAHGIATPVRISADTLIPPKLALQEKGPTNPMDTGNCEKKKKKRKERETEKENKNWQLWQPGCKVRAWGAPKTHNRHPFPCSPFFNPATPSSPGYGPGWTPPPSTHRSPPRSAAVAWGTALGELN